MTEFAGVVTDPTTGKQKFRWEGLLEFEYPFDPSKPIFFAAAPPGGVAHANMPFMVKGDRGLPTLFSTNVDFTALEPDDVTPDSFEVVELVPGTDTTSQVLKVVVKLHKGEAGTDGASVLNPGSFGTPTFKHILQVNAAGDGFELVAQRVGGKHYPAAAATAAPAGTTAGFDIQQVVIPANTYPFPYRLEVSGGTVTTASSADAQVDLIARLNTTSGPVLGRCTGVGGVTDRLILVDGLDDSALAAGASAAAADVTLAANAGATVYLRTEKQGGTATYQSSAAATRLSVRVVAVP